MASCALDNVRAARSNAAQRSPGAARAPATAPRSPAMPVVKTVFRNEFEDQYTHQLNDFDWVFLAEGDSWFSYGSLRFRNVLLDMDLPQSALILNIAQPGDTLRRMHETCRNPELYFFLKNRGGRRWNAILLSGGGNDVIDAAWNGDIGAPEIFVKPADPAAITAANLRTIIKQPAYDALFEYIAANVQQIVLQGRDQAGGNSVDVPLFMHTYALLQPRNAPVKYIKSGPWLYQACVWLGIDESLWIEVAKMVLSDLATTLKALDLPNFHVIDTLALTTSMLPSAPGTTGNSNDWENEIHPNRGGYRKLAATWSEEIANVLV
jgi:lysophospholipase L1-like esterase